jgi:hypothetical protein
MADKPTVKFMDKITKITNLGEKYHTAYNSKYNKGIIACKYNDVYYIIYKVMAKLDGSDIKVPLLKDDIQYLQELNMFNVYDGTIGYGNDCSPPDVKEIIRLRKLSLPSHLKSDNVSYPDRCTLLGFVFANGGAYYVRQLDEKILYNGEYCPTYVTREHRIVFIEYQKTYLALGKLTEIMLHVGTLGELTESDRKLTREWGFECPFFEQTTNQSESSNCTRDKLNQLKQINMIGYSFPNASSRYDLSDTYTEMDIFRCRKLIGTINYNNKGYVAYFHEETMFVIIIQTTPIETSGLYSTKYIVLGKIGKIIQGVGYLMPLDDTDMSIVNEYGFGMPPQQKDALLKIDDLLAVDLFDGKPIYHLTNDNYSFSLISGGMFKARRLDKKIRYKEGNYRVYIMNDYLYVFLEMHGLRIVLGKVIKNNEGVGVLTPLTVSDLALTRRYELQPSDAPFFSDLEKISISNPTTSIPLAEKTSMTNPTTNMPSIFSTKPETTKPETAKPETAKSETAKPETAKPETAKPETAKPETAKPETAKPETAKPETAKPEITILETSRPKPAKSESIDSSQIGMYQKQIETLNESMHAMIDINRRLTILLEQALMNKK